MQSSPKSLRADHLKISQAGFGASQLLIWEEQKIWYNEIKRIERIKLLSFFSHSLFIPASLPFSSKSKIREKKTHAKYDNGRVHQTQFSFFALRKRKVYISCSYFTIRKNITCLYVFSSLRIVYNYKLFLFLFLLLSFCRFLLVIDHQFFPSFVNFSFYKFFTILTFMNIIVTV